jgi:predicted PurR-regulated permease PerM
MIKEFDKKYIILVIILLIIYMAFIIIKPFITAVLTAIVIAYVFYPVYQRLYSKLKRKNLSSLIITLSLILLIILPLAYIINSLSKEVYRAPIFFKKTLVTGNLFGIDCEQNRDNRLCKISETIRSFLSEPKNRFYVDDTFKKTTNFLTAKLSNFILAIPRRLFDVFIIFFTMFYLFRDGKKLVTKINNLIPAKKEHKRKIVKKLDEITYAVVFGSIITALIQGAIGAFGFFIFGLILYKISNIYSSVLLGSPILWGIIMAFFALIPFLGTYVIWFPIGLFQLIAGFINNNSPQIGIGIGILIYGFFVISMVDNILKPKLIGDRAKIHPVIILLGVFGGLALFGFIGIIIGPTILALLVTLIEIYEEK